MKGIIHDAPTPYDAGSFKVVVFVSNLRERLKAPKASEGSLTGDVESQIRVLYSDLALLANEVAHGNDSPGVRERIETSFNRLRSLQTLQANEIRARFRASVRISLDDIRRLEAAERLLRERENPPRSDNTPR